MIAQRPASPPTALGAPGREPGGLLPRAMTVDPAVALPQSRRSGALPDPVTFAVLVLQLILLGLFALLLQDLSFDADRTEAALAGLARGFPTSRALIPADDAARRAPLAPALQEIAATWRAATQQGPGRVSAGSWLGRDAVTLALPARALLTDDGGLSLVAERWLQPAVGVLEDHGDALLILGTGSPAAPAALARLERLRRELVARGAPAARLALRLDPALAPETLAFTLAIAPAVFGAEAAGGGR